MPNTVWYNYRRVPAVVLLKHLLDEGKFGRIFHYRAKFLQDWTISADLPQGGEGLWRLDVKVAGSGVTGDLLAHCIDTALWLNGSISEVTAMTETFIKERKHNLTGKVEPVGIDDACAFLCRFKNGSLATFESTRYARGHKALYTLEINGEHASAAWDLHDLHRIQYFDHKDEGRVRGWRSMHVTDGDHPYMKHWWVPGLQIGYEHTFIHQFADFVQAAAEGKSVGPTFRDGLATDYVTDAVLKSAGTRKWEKVRPADAGHQSMCRVRALQPDQGRTNVQDRRRYHFHHRRQRGARRPAAACRSGAAGQGQGQGQRGGGGGMRGPQPIPYDDRTGFQPIFDGTSMKNWDGDPAYWRVEGGALVGESTEANPVKENTFLIYRGGEPADFELKVEFRINTTNSGVQYRSVQVPPDEKTRQMGAEGIPG